ncbi:hypothetical protein [Flavobacterium sp. C4GT6]|uniref:hypothetical protein n=1 Tax=Flavobacterium sp. C4GT6 TaxID=3103818 RepID=UPI002ED095BF
MNKERKIADEEVKQLYAFTRKHFVEYYDLQTELVDHLANAIEEKWQQQPGLLFDDALQQEFKKFGVFGFMDVVERRQMALTKKYRKLLWAYFREYFKLPKILLTIVLTVLLAKSIQHIHAVIAPILLFSILIFSLVRFFVLNHRYRKKVKQTGYRWMLEEIIFRCGSLPVFIFIPYQIIEYVYDKEYSTVGQWILAAAVVLFAIYQYIILYVIINRAEVHLEQTYPEYKLLKQ